MHSVHKHYSHIYLEKAAAGYPIARETLARFPNAKVIEIDNYKEIFNRKKQDWRLQKESLKLILAVKKDDFMYSGSKFTPSFSNQNFFYNTLMMNCIYDCHYCYLQGMYPSANTVIFVNLEDYFIATDRKLEELGSIYLSISYDTDLLAFENVVSYTNSWIDYTRSRENLQIEVRTKSANYAAIKNQTPCDNVILAWTFSPQAIIDKYETKTPNLKARLNAAHTAMNDGWRVRLCFDPILLVADWKLHYQQLFEEVFNTLDTKKISDISLGTFRMNREFFKNMRDSRVDSDLIHFPFKTTDKTIGYAEQDRLEMINFSRDWITSKFPAEKIYLS